MPNPERFGDAPRMNVGAPSALDLRSRSWGPGGAMRDRIDGPPVNYGVLPALGNVLTIAAAVTAADAIWLPRPAGSTRIFLFVQNLDPAATAFLAFDQIATATVGGGSLILSPGAAGPPATPGASFTFMDFVPQNDVHLVASAACAVLIWYCNAAL